MLPAWIPTMAALLILACCLGVMIGRRAGIAEERERWNNVGKFPGKQISEAFRFPVTLPDSRVPRWSDPCPGTITEEHEWIDVTTLDDDPPGYYRKLCVACGSNMIGPTDASPKAFGGRA